MNPTTSYDAAPCPDGALDGLGHRIQALANMLRNTNDNQTFTRDRLLGCPPETRQSDPTSVAQPGAIGALNAALDVLDIEVSRASNLVGDFARL